MSADAPTNIMDSVRDVSGEDEENQPSKSNMMYVLILAVVVILIICVICTVKKKDEKDLGKKLSKKGWVLFTRAGCGWCTSL